VLWKELTVKEHLKMFALLKGVDSDAQEEEIAYILNKLQMYEHADRRVSELSGGQQRKVNLGIAFIGSPKLVILDEPSKSLDPIKRRKFWDLTKGKRVSGQAWSTTTRFSSRLTSWKRSTFCATESASFRTASFDASRTLKSSRLA